MHKSGSIVSGHNEFINIFQNALTTNSRVLEQPRKSLLFSSAEVVFTYTMHLFTSYWATSITKNYGAEEIVSSFCKFILISQVYFRWFRVLVFRLSISGIPTFRHSGIPAFRHSSIPAFWHSAFSTTHEGTNLFLHVIGIFPLLQEKEKCISHNIPALGKHVVKIILRFLPMIRVNSKGITRDILSK